MRKTWIDRFSEKMEYSTLEALLVKLVCSVEFPINQSNTETGDQLSSETADQSSVGSIKISGLDHKLGKFISRQMVQVNSVW